MFGLLVATSILLAEYSSTGKEKKSLPDIRSALLSLEEVYGHEVNLDTPSSLSAIVENFGYKPNSSEVVTIQGDTTNSHSKVVVLAHVTKELRMGTIRELFALEKKRQRFPERYTPHGRPFAELTISELPPVAAMGSRVEIWNTKEKKKEWRCPVLHADGTLQFISLDRLIEMYKIYNETNQVQLLYGFP